MDTSIIVQLIETVGLLLIPLMIWILSKNILKCKKNIEREINLSNDLLFFRAVIEKYKTVTKENEGKTNYIKFRDEVEKEIGYSTSTASYSSVLKQRLVFLEKSNQKIDTAIDKI